MASRRKALPGVASCFSALVHEEAQGDGLGKPELPPRRLVRRVDQLGHRGHRVRRLAHRGAVEAAAKSKKILPLVRFELTIPRYPPNPPEAGALPLGHRGSPIIKLVEETHLYTVDFECPERMLGHRSGSQFTVYNKVAIHLSGSGVRFSLGIQYQKRMRWLLHY